MAIAMRGTWAASWQFWATLAVTYAALSALAVRQLHERQLVAARMKPRGGDVSIGILLGLLMVVAGVVVQRWLAPLTSPQAGWLAAIYIQVGNIQNSGPLIAMLASLGLMEELVWRGMVLEALRDRFGPRWAAPTSALFYSVAHIPTLFTLQVAPAGPNPLLVVAALGAGLLWGFAAMALSRLWPVIIAHVVFSYFMSAPLPPWLNLG